jgi:uncharacterized RDD family membrane protein YckC
MAGYLLDVGLGLVASLPLWYAVHRFGDGPEDGATLIVATLAVVLCLGFNLYNVVVRQGRTGYSLGKTLVGIQLVRIDTGRPMGVGRCLVRFFAHYVDTLACYLGWLWPLWDARRQTLADKMTGTVVVVQPQDRAGA